MNMYWVYAENIDEAGTIVASPSPDRALSVALEYGFTPHGAVCWAYELGPLHCLGRVQEHEEIENMTLATALSYFSEEAANKKDPYLSKAVQLILDATKEGKP